MKKILILVLTIGLPLGIFLFLKYFGVNRFSVPIEYAHGIAGCDSADHPHVVPPISFNTINGDISGTTNYKGFKVYGFLLVSDPVIYNKLLYQLGRVQDAFVDNPDVTLFTLSTKDLFSGIGMKAFENYRTVPDKWIIGTIGKVALNEFLECGVGVSKKFPDNENQKNTTVVLVDNAGLIRGYYDGSDTEETERLIVELKILLREDSLNKLS